MDGLQFTAETARVHAPLVQRASAIISALGHAGPVWLTSTGEALPDRTVSAITLERGPVSRLSRLSARRFALAYADPTSDAALAALLASSAAPGAPIAASPESLSILSLAERLAVSEIPVLIAGPTGTGKEVLSRFIHERSPRSRGPFVAVNCAAMPEAMLEALLFGHTKGAFTGATQASEGFFRAADGGTLLLDEIAEMPLSLQAKLLRALQEGEVVPIGSTVPVRIDVRVIAAANRDLPTEVAEGRFRADLFYRLNVFPLTLKPLRERAEDIAPLAFALMMRHAPAGRALPWISDAALAMLRVHGWPGNVRELENVIRRALLLASGEHEIRPQHIHFDSAAKLVNIAPAQPAGQALPAQAGGFSAGVAALDERLAGALGHAFDGEAMLARGASRARRRLANIVQISEAKAIMETLEACGGSRVAAARALGISERTLRYRLASFREAGLPMQAGAMAPLANGAAQ